MNLLLLEPGEVAPDGTARLTGRRLVHARRVLAARPGDRLRVGELGGAIGEGEVLEVDEDAMLLRVSLHAPPPPRPGVSLVLALPRPKQLRRVLPALASLGVDRVALVNAARVEKSYFSARALEPRELRSLLALGLEQARDTRAPEVELRPLFRPFVEDELGSWCRGAGTRLVAHPSGDVDERPLPDGGPIVLAVGPEGGWVPFELELLRAAGFVPWSAGPRTLRVETAVPYLLGLLAPR